MSFTVEVSALKQPITREVALSFEMAAKVQLAHFNGNEVAMYTYGGKRHNHILTGSEKRLVIFINATFEGVLTGEDYKLDVEEVMYGIQSGVKVILPVAHMGTVIVTPEGRIVAEFVEDKNTINILFDVTKSPLKVFEKIMEEVNKVFFEKTRDKSWLFTRNKSALIEQVKEKAVLLLVEERRKAENKVREYQEEMHSAKSRLANYIRKYNSAMSKLNGSAAEEVKSLEKYMSELDAICKLEKVKDVIVENGNVTILTHVLHIHDDSRGKVYYGGEYSITLEPERTNVYFRGGTPRKSYWGDSCPHPHVNEHGGACLGSMQQTIAELCADYELYALALMSIDFLESVNTEDAAGKNVVSWDVVNKDGSISPADSAERFNCHTSGDSFPIDESRRCDHCGNLSHHESFHEVFDIENGEEAEDACGGCVEEMHFDNDREMYVINNDEESDGE
jgi:hypothetical protein